MSIEKYIAFGFLVLLVIVLALIIGYYFGSKRKKKVEDPKYRMLDDD